MKRKIFWTFLVLWLVLTAYLFCLSEKWASAAESRTVTPENFAAILQEALQNDPDLLLNVLRNNSEAVLDIAQQGSNQRRRKALIKQWKEEANQPRPVNIKDLPVRGPADAPITIVAFSDFTCPYCQQASVTVQKLLKDYHGKVKYVFKHFPLEGGPARLAAEYHVAASRQGADKAWQLYDLLFARRAALLQDSEATLNKTARDVGLDMKRLAADLKSKAVRDAVDADIAEAAQLGVQGTPYFLVNNLVVRGALSPELFAEAINIALQSAEKK